MTKKTKNVLTDWETEVKRSKAELNKGEALYVGIELVVKKGKVTKVLLYLVD